MEMVFQRSCSKAPPFPSPEEMLAIKSMEHSRKHLRRPQGKLLPDAQTFEVQAQCWPQHSDTQLMLAAQGTSVRLSHAQRPTSQVLLQGFRKMSLNPQRQLDSKYNYWEDGGAKETRKKS